MAAPKATAMADVRNGSENKPQNESANEIRMEVLRPRESLKIPPSSEPKRVPSFATVIMLAEVLELKWRSTKRTGISVVPIAQILLTNEVNNTGLSFLKINLVS